MPHDRDITQVDSRLLDELTTIVSMAAAAILASRAHSLDARTKADLSPVTAADHAGEAVILEGLARLLPGVCVVSEEAAGCAPPASIPASFVLVDPLDGTRELLAGRDEFTVNVAIVTGGRPRLGIVAAPARGLLWRGIEGQGAERLRLSPGAPASAAQERTAIHTRTAQRAGFVAMVSRSHLDPQTSHSSRGCRSLIAAYAARRSNSVASPKGAPTSIRAFRPPASGMWPPATRCWQPRAAP